MSFTHLSLHTEFSLIDGTIRIKKLFETLKERGATAVALTDMGNAFGAIKFYQEAIKAKIKPILGADLLLKLEDDSVGRITLLAKDYEGYLNLSRLISHGYLDHQKQGIPYTTREDLLKYEAGLILILSKESHFGQTLLHRTFEQADRELNQLYAPFREDRLYIGVKRLNQADDERFIQAAKKFATEHHLPLLAHNDVRFMERDDFLAHEVRSCIANGYIINDPSRPKNYSEEQYLKSAEEMSALFADLPEAIENTHHLAERCTVMLELGKPQLPHFDTPDGMSMEEYFRKICREGLIERVGEPSEENSAYWERLEVELKVIIEMGFPDYFLIVADFIRWSKENDIPVGPGRGSGAGSLVAWALSITNLDPLPYDLLFERFLNPERISMPDFDVDFCVEGRERVIDYVAQKYGRAAVSQIATHGRMAAKAVVRDVGRALGHPYGFVDRIAKLIPPDLGMTLEKAMAQEPDLYALYQDDEEVKALLDYALELEGLTKSIGRHAGGVVISPTTITDFSPLYCEEGNSSISCQYDKDDIEAAGLVKFDFLGLRTLTIIDWAVKNIVERHEKPIDIDSIPLDDKGAFDLLKSAKTTAVFQLESRGMKDLIQRLQPDTFEDIVALVALFRPGPLDSGMVDDFVNRKHGIAEPDYIFPELEDVLSPTYGVIVYQEQVMQISQIIGNYTLGGADLLRRAMGAKLPEVMAEQRAIFMSGAKELGFDPKKAGYLFDLMEKFAGYGFNKSHSAAYAILTYQTAYLKAHYPAEFMAAVLSSELDHTDKLVIFVDECRQMGVTIRRPNINESSYQFTVNKEGDIVYGLGGLKGYGSAAAQQLVEEREENGPYQSLFDFCERIDRRKTGKRALEILIKSGALDTLNPNLDSIESRAAFRASLIASIPEAWQLAEQKGRDANSGQIDLFGILSEEEQLVPAPQLTHATPYTKHELLNFERETLGFYFTAHPVDQYREELGHLVSLHIGDLKMIPEPDFKRYQPSGDADTLIAGLVTNFRSHITKSNRKMYFVTIDDGTGSLELPLFDEHLENFGMNIEVNTILFISGHQQWDEYNGQTSLKVESLQTLHQIRERRSVGLLLSNRESITQKEIAPLMQLLHQHRSDEQEGNRGIPIFIDYGTDYCRVLIQFPKSNPLRIIPSLAFSEAFQRGFSQLFRAEYKY